jgi:hypothetical protein
LDARRTSGTLRVTPPMVRSNVSIRVATLIEPPK